MKVPKWLLPILLHFLSLSRLTSASADNNKASAAGLVLGFRLVPTLSNNTQPSPSPAPLSLDLNFFVQVANHELSVPIMPLHLLGKKSWNVYNTDNIEKVRRDEARAKAQEEADEQRMQQLDDERRMQILRGEEPTPLLLEDSSKQDETARPRYDNHGGGRERKRRKKASENDTDFEMRIAHEKTSSSSAGRELVLRRDVDAPLTDHNGHIDLFPQEKPTPHQEVQKNEEAERELAKKKKSYEDQYTMKFSNAAGFKQTLSDNPWYSKKSSTTVQADVMPDKDVWGNEDPRRLEREKKRIVDNDPLAMMKVGARQVREVAKERKKWVEEKEREMKELDAQDRRRKHKRRRERDEEDDLESFRLDNTGRESPSRRHNDGDRERRHRHSSNRRHSHRSDDRRRRHKSRRHIYD
ncbi:hypothetical protein BJ875DRAFT_11708 [Amylocarpus encephaloides]|uniref:CBF1-interacting co-repressor CIR N-terminal domain-containing protein n=1 Tax=Amylocarpus encephaloides TaxID=45428 RepID=A0A9P7YJT1_9HELO|nr:hypothetical protein BJ875DRAFT_11708 [Amylocarpus encephaloides]